MVIMKFYRPTKYHGGFYGCALCGEPVEHFDQKRKALPMDIAFEHGLNAQITVTLQPCGHRYRWFSA